jgi:predicted N-acetyltransferase YhbS
MRQVAVREDVQGQGVGRMLVRYSESVAREQGFETMMLHARETAVPFYKRLGYAIKGGRFIEVTLPHYTMCKPI